MASNRAGKVSTFARLLVVDDPKILEIDEKLRSWYTPFIILSTFSRVQFITINQFAQH